jgi:hypothetical protein
VIVLGANISSPVMLDASEGVAVVEGSADQSDG